MLKQECQRSVTKQTEARQLDKEYLVHFSCLYTWVMLRSTEHAIQSEYIAQAPPTLPCVSGGSSSVVTYSVVLGNHTVVANTRNNSI